MLSSEEWKKEVVRESINICPKCQSPDFLTMGACAIGAISVHQEYVCENCGHEFRAMFLLFGCVAGNAADLDS